jgi:hypothetical protein
VSDAVPAPFRLTALAAVFGCCLAVGAALAADEPGQKPPAQPKPAGEKDCIVSGGGFKMSGKTPTYVIALENMCEKRLRCTVYANVMGARGSAQGHKTLTLAPHSKGPKAKQSYVLKVKSMGGIAQASRECKVL